MSIGAVDETPESVDPNAVDAISGQLPPALQPPPAAIPGGNLTPEQLAAAATVPLNPAASPLDAELAKLPASLPPQAPPPKTPVEAAARNVEEAAKIGEEKTVNAEEKAALDTKTAIARQTFLKDHGEAFQKVLDAQEQHRQAAEQAVTVARNKAETEPYHTLFETRSTAQKVAIALSLLVGGVSWNENHVNRGAQMLEAATKADFETQKLKHADLWRAVNEAQQGAKDLDAKQLRDLSAFNMSQGAKWDRISSELGALIAANKGKSDVSEAKSQALKANETANTFFQNATSAAATARHLEAMDAERILHDREIEKAKAKKAAAAGGGGSSAVNEAAVKLREEIEAAQAGKPVTDSKGNVLNPDGKPLTGGQIDRRALELKIPPVAKAGRTSVKTILDKIKEEGAIKGQEEHDININSKEKDKLVRDPDTGKVYGKAESPKAAAKFRTDDINYKDAAHRMNELAEDIKAHGAKVTDPTDVARRVTKFANAVIAVGIVSPLGKTNETLHLETDSIGIPGTLDPTHLRESITRLVTTNGANLEAVQAKVKEILHKREMFRKTLAPVTEDEIKKFSNSGGESTGKWVAIPARLSGESEAKGKKEMLVGPGGKFLGEFR